MPKISKTYRLDTRALEYLQHIHKSSGVNNTKKIEQLIFDDAGKLAKVSPEVETILKKTPVDYEKEKAEKVGLWGPK